MKLNLILMCVSQLFNMLTPDMLKSIFDSILNFIEDIVKKTETEIDDALVMPIIAMIRESLAIIDKNPNSVDIHDKLLKVVFELLKQLLTLVPTTFVKLIFDKLLDVVEDYVKNTENTVDDGVVLPFCNVIRTSFDIPDND